MEREKKMKKSLVIILALVMVFSFCLAACGGDGGNTNTNSDTNGGDAYKEVTVGSFGTDWSGYLDGTGLESRALSWGTYNLVYDCMFTYDENGEIYSQIFDSWEWSDDNLTLTCHLKDGITFANGDEMTAEDILFSVERKVASPTVSWLANLDPAQCTASEDGRTVNLVYKETYGPGLKVMTVYILDKSFVESLGETPDWYDTASVNGSGPYKITEYTQNATITFEKRDDYWGEDTFEADKINVITYTDQTTMMIDLESGALDIAMNTSETDTATALDGGVENVAGEVAWANAVSIMTMNPLSEAFKDEAVRQAICYAVDTDAMNAVAFGCLGKTADSVYAEGLLGYEGGHSFEYNPELARQILADAGYKDGDINLKYLCFNLSDTYAQGEILQQQLAAVGINLELESATIPTVIGQYMEDPTCTDFMAARQLDGIPTGEPWLSMYAFEGDYYIRVTAMPDEAELQEYLHTLKTSLDEAERIEVSHKIQAYFIDHFLAIPTSEFGIGVCYRTDTVVNPHILNNTTCNLRYVDLV